MKIKKLLQNENSKIPLIVPKNQLLYQTEINNFVLDFGLSKTAAEDQASISRVQAARQNIYLAKKQRFFLENEIRFLCFVLFSEEKHFVYSHDILDQLQEFGILSYSSSD